MPDERRQRVRDRLSLLNKSQKLNGSSQIDRAISLVKSEAERALLLCVRDIDTKMNASLQNQEVLAESHDLLAEDVSAVRQISESGKVMTDQNVSEIKTMNEWIATKRDEDKRETQRTWFKLGMRAGKVQIWGAIVAGGGVGIAALWAIFKFVFEMLLKQHGN